MKCVICHSDEIVEMNVNEEIAMDNNVVYVPITIPVCKNCGERYYDRRTMKFLEETQSKIRNQKLELREIGKVLIYDEPNSV